MNKLPTEVIIEMTSPWSFKDKLNLACTCKQLHRAISENTLYNKLVFKDKVKFGQAMQMNNNKNILQQVRDLCIVNMKNDTQLISALPTLFPRVRFLNFESDPNESGIQTTGVDTNSLEVTATNWRNVEEVSDKSNIMNVTIRLLSLLTFDQLRSLEISCELGERTTIIQRHERTQALILSIHNAPSLEELIFDYPIMDIQDMEILHAKATNLSYIWLNNCDFYTDNAVNNQPLQPPAGAVVSFNLYTTAPVQLISDRRTEVQDQTLGNAIGNWISYIGMKYPQLEILYLNFMLNYIDLAMEDKDLITTCLATAVTNMKHLKSYTVDLPYHLQPALDVMKSNGVQLYQFGFLVDFDDVIEEKFKSVQTAQLLSSISFLNIYCDTNTDTLSMINPLMNLCNSLQHLTDLTLNSYLSDHVVILFIDIIQNLTMLKKLELGALWIQKGTTDDLFYNKVSNIQTLTRMESVRVFRFFVDEGDNTAIRKMNRLFAFILQSCPNLKEVVLLGQRIGPRGEVNLDFRGNTLLQQIKLDLPGCRYYRFHHEFGKCWRNVRQEIEQDDDLTLKQEQDLPFIINLAWDTAMDIDIQLFGCGL